MSQTTSTLTGLPATSMSEEGEFDATLKAVILYDDFELAAQANARLARAANWTSESAHWDVRPWRLDLLRLPSVAKTALGEAVEAHLLVLALRQSEALPGWLPDWLEQWATCRQVPDTALAIFGGRPVGELSTWALPQLSRFAARHGLHFIFDQGLAPVEVETSGMASSLHERELAQTPTMAEFSEHVSRVGYRDWGIND